MVEYVVPSSFFPFRLFGKKFVKPEQCRLEKARQEVDGLLVRLEAEAKILGLPLEDEK